MRPSEHLWMTIAEAAYQRAAEEQPAEEVSKYGETVLLQDKITFWRTKIPAAAGLPGEARILVEEQRKLQLEWYTKGGVQPPEVALD